MAVYTVHKRKWRNRDGTTGYRYYFNQTLNGERKRIPLPTARTKTQAEEAAIKIAAEIHNGTYGSPSNQTFNEFVERVFWPWALDNYRDPMGSHYYHTEAIKAFFGKYRLKQITPMLIERFKSLRLKTPTIYKRPRSLASVNRELLELSRILRMARKNRIITENPFSEVKLFKVDNKRERPLTDEEEPVLMAGLTGVFEWLKTPVVLALNTGMRRGEICKFTPRMFNLSKQTLRLTGDITKNKRQREIPLNQTAFDLMIEHVAGKPADEPALALDPDAITQAFSRLTRKLGLEDMRFHDLRHTFSTRLGAQGIDPYTIMEILGWQDLKMVPHYTHALERNKRHAVASVEVSSAAVTMLSQWQRKEAVG